VGTANNVEVIGNRIDDAGGDAIFNSGTGTTIRDNYGFATEASGTASIIGDGSTVTSVQVAHGLDGMPTVMTVTPTSDLGSASKVWVDSIDGTNFTINLDADPGSEVEVTFSWEAKSR